MLQVASAPGSERGAVPRPRGVAAAGSLVLAFVTFMVTLPVSEVEVIELRLGQILPSQ